MAQFKKMLLTPGIKGRPGKSIIPKAIVIHWTANLNAGANAVANRNYFNSGVAASAHYIVDDSTIVQCIPETEMAYHVGAKKYTARALAELSSYPNNCTLGIEMCVNKDGDFTKTYQNTVELTADILKRHGWGTERLWRHYDVTGKDCPRYFINDITAKQFGFYEAAQGWKRFKNDVRDAMQKETIQEVIALFNDIKGHWAQASIEKLAEPPYELIKGDGSGNFNPDKPITRAETIVIIDRLLKYLGR